MKLLLVRLSRIAALAALVLLMIPDSWAQPYKLRGTVIDGATNETLVGAAVVVKGTTNGATTDVNGRFELTMSEMPPYTLVVSYLGYSSLVIEVKSLDQNLKFKLSTDQVLLKEAEVVGSRISEKQKQAPLTVESMDIIAIKEAPSGSFYESLGTLKGVDMTAASMGFRVINTRGFNSTSPVRSLQLIDGVDNQSPGLNFSLGNFLGASDLDVMKVDIVAGASSAYFGPGAFNGVINMTTKSPWMFPGLSVSVKGGERSLFEGAVRYAQVLKDKNGKDRWAYKVNAYAMNAEDWVANNFTATVNSPTGVTNPGGYDGVNSYGDENVTTNNDYTGDATERNDLPGLGTFLRRGYNEEDLTDYSTYNLKFGGSLHYRFTDGDSTRAPVELILASNFSTGSTVYQGDNRYRLQDVKFFQHRLELKEQDRWFFRTYLTHEDAGNTYDIFTTAIKLQEASGSTRNWNTAYANIWGNGPNSIEAQVEARPDYITLTEAGQLGWTANQWIDWQDQYIQDNLAYFTGLHQLVTDSVNKLNTGVLDPAYAVGTDRFDAKFQEITGSRFTDGGSLFYDRSMLYHAMAERRFKPAFAELVVGGNFRQYLPNSAGTIFKDTGDVVIRNSEFGLYGGLEKVMMEEKLRLTATLRLDKNQNFDALLSPAASLVWTPEPEHVFRFSFSSALRNPTLADQYLFYNVGRAYLLGNVEGQFEEGRDSLCTVGSFDIFRDSQIISDLDYFHVDRLRPERVRTLEFGYRGTLFDNWYFDAGYYHSWYTDFIGYIIGLQPAFNYQFGVPVFSGLTAYRLAANAADEVRTQGVNFGANFFRKRITYGLNWSWNVLTSGEDDPIIPAFNTPEFKYNLSATAHEWRIPFTTRQDLGWGINYKWVQGFTFEGSPQFSGPIPTYDMVDAQVNVAFPRAKTTVKLGCSNLFGLQPLFDADVPGGEKWDRMWNNNVLLVFGGPYVGRLAYLQLTYEFNKK